MQFTINDIVLYKDKPTKISSISNEYAEIFVTTTDLYSNVLCKAIKPMLITKEFIEKNKLVELYNIHNLYTFEQDKCNNYVELYIDENRNVIYIEIENINQETLVVAKIQYVHELQQILRLYHLCEIADNFIY